MLKPGNVENMEKISEKLTKSHRDLCEMLCTKAMEEGAIRLHPTSTHFFATNPKNICAILANRLTQKYNPVVSAMCKDICYALKIDFIIMLTIWVLDEKQMKLSCSKNSRNLRTKYYLILIYREMYDPALINNFLDNLKLITTFGKNNFTSALKSGGGSGTPAILSALNEEVFVGNKAYNFYLNEPIIDDTYEIISANVIKTIRKLKKIFPALVSQENATPVLNDFWLKTTEIKNNDRVICVIYNSAEYELIPFIKADVRIGSLFVVTRFILIKNMIASLHGHDSDYTIHDRLISNIKDEEYFIPPIENYYGINISLRALFSKCEKEMDYKPIAVKKKLGHFIYF